MQVRAHLWARQGRRGSTRLHRLSLPLAVLAAELGFNQCAPASVTVTAPCATPSAAVPRARPPSRRERACKGGISHAGAKRGS